MPKHDTYDAQLTGHIKELMAFATPEEIAAYQAIEDEEERLAEAYRLYRLTLQRRKEQG